MAWSKAVIETRAAATGTGVKASLKKLRNSAAKLTLTLAAARIKALGWSAGDGIEILMGTGEHHGLLRLRKNNSVSQVKLAERQARGGSYFTVSLGNQPAFVDRTEAARWCQWEAVEAGWFEVVSPKRVDETAPARRPAAVPARPVASVPARPAGRHAAENVTASLMGDPPPGRREALEKI